jgi:asparagine synthase (glutamine-hydrolysing)
MCGIVGIVGRPGLDRERSEIARAMAASIVHRGPDGEGFARRDGCDLGLRRLAIVDPGGPAGPFSNEDGTVWSVCNGEIYNSEALRAGLEGRGHRLESRNDTEVLPHLYEEHGADFVERLDGMFALAVWDERRRILLLARDRAGEKPLFYWEGDGEFAFASELRALMAHPRLDRGLDPVALRRYLLHDFFPAPYTPLAAVRKVPAAERIVVRDGRVADRRTYWDLADVYRRAETVVASPGAIAEKVDDLLSRAVRRRKRGDTAVGVFLSGGLDSAAILAHLADQEGPGVPVFSIGHTDPAFDEAGLARATARRFDADFDALVLGEADLADGLRRVAVGFDEPLGDASTLPTHLLALRARQKVKVILSGEGADELLAGYPTYLGHRLAARLDRLPTALRRGLVGLARRVTPVRMSNVGLDYLVARFVRDGERQPLERHHAWFGSLTPERMDPILSPALREALRSDDPFASARAIGGGSFRDELSRFLYTDFRMYLQDDLLTKVDRATMLASLEARAPFLDHELAEFLASLPSTMKLRGVTTKLVLRRALRARLPDAVLKRRKRGFNVPLSRWLLRGLGERLRDRFSPERVRARGLFAPEGVRRLLDEHLAREADHRKSIFSLLALDLWCDRTYGEGAAVPLAGAPDAPAGTATAS